jgi:hypothetical protein
MTQRNSMTEDVFEKARAAFFGTIKTLPRPIDEPVESLNPRDKSTPKEITPGSLTTSK